MEKLPTTGSNDPPPGGAKGVIRKLVQIVHGGPKYPTQDETREGVRSFFVFFLFGALVWITVLSWATGSLVTFGALGMISAASTIAGAFLGFLFGIPRSLASTAASLVEQSQAGTKTTVTPNTNLEQISDWLTKILVGVGLTQLQSLPKIFSDLSASLAALLPNVPAGGIVTLASIIAFLFAGFLWAYFESRTALMPLFEQQTDLQQTGEMPPHDGQP
jgi:glucan phosphoethanolaminetransferase (alkaline phosphatase superfamily)